MTVPPEDSTDAWLMLLRRIDDQIKTVNDKLDSGAFVGRAEWEERKTFTDHQIEALETDTDKQLAQISAKLDGLQPRRPQASTIIAALVMLATWVTTLLMLHSAVIIR